MFSSVTCERLTLHFSKASAAEVSRTQKIAPLTLHEDLREEYSTVRRARNPDTGVRELSVQDVRAVLRRDHPALDGEGGRVVEALIISDVLAECPPAVESEFRSPPRKVESAAFNVAQNSFARHRLRMVARDARQRAVENQRPQSPPLALGVDEFKRAPLVARRGDRDGGRRSRI